MRAFFIYWEPWGSPWGGYNYWLQHHGHPDIVQKLPDLTPMDLSTHMHNRDIKKEYFNLKYGK